LSRTSGFSSSDSTTLCQPKRLRSVAQRRNRKNKNPWQLTTHFLKTGSWWSVPAHAPTATKIAYADRTASRPLARSNQWWRWHREKALPAETFDHNGRLAGDRRRDRRGQKRPLSADAYLINEKQFVDVEVDTRSVPTGEPTLASMLRQHLSGRSFSKLSAIHRRRWPGIGGGLHETDWVVHRDAVSSSTTTRLSMSSNFPEGKSEFTFFHEGAVTEAEHI